MLEHALRDALIGAINKNLDPAAKAHQFVIARSPHNGQYYWTYYDGNYKKIATSGETFVSKEVAEGAVENVKKEIKTYC